jgi:hypothetical protein
MTADVGFRHGGRRDECAIDAEHKFAVNFRSIELIVVRAD